MTFKKSIYAHRASMAPPPPTVLKKATIYQIAEKAGLHPMTVSRALRPGTSVSKETRQTVQRIAQELGYKRDPIGAALRSGQTLEVGVSYETLTRADFASVLSELNLKLTPHGYYVRILEPHPVKLTVQSLAGFNAAQVRGMMFANNVEPGVIDWLAERKIPAIWLMERPDVSDRPFHFYGSEDRPAAGELLAHLHQLGHRQIAFFDAETPTFGSLQRKEVYLAFTAKHGLPVLLETSTFEPQGGAESIERLLRRLPQVTAVFCSNDNTAIGAMFRLQQLGYRVPQDISVVGFGSPSSRHYEYFYPGLSTARHEYNRIGLLAADALVALMLGEDVEPQDRLVPSEVILRGTTAPPSPTPRRALV
jgi:DNA-binding LacI/PurR family transcriptional regulator